MEQLIAFRLNKEESLELDRNSMVQRLQNLPNYVQPLDSQVAGHENEMFRDANTGHILKPILDKRGKREVRFYQFVFDNEIQINVETQNRTLLQTLQRFLPKYFGEEIINEVQFIRLENIIGSMTSPNLMDVKIGQITYDRFANENKITRELSKLGTHRTEGYRILGVKIFDSKRNQFQTTSRENIKKLTADQAFETILNFVNHYENHRYSIVSQMLNKLIEIEKWFAFDNLNRFEFISSSILFAYSVSERGNVIVNVKMIDFAHVFPLIGSKCLSPNHDYLDHNYLFGLRNLIKVFQKIVVN